CVILNINYIFLFDLIFL
ncbi:hypothetical protein Zm00014a_022907, partial [Zea mays]